MGKPKKRETKTSSGARKRRASARDASLTQRRTSKFSEHGVSIREIADTPDEVTIRGKKRKVVFTHEVATPVDTYRATSRRNALKWAHQYCRNRSR